MATPTHEELRAAAMAAEENERYDDAIAHLEALRAVSPSDVQVLLDLARVHGFRKRFDLAVAVAREAVALSPGSERALFVLATALRRNSQPVDAVAIYERILSANPTDQETRAGYALAICDLGQADKAFPIVSALREENPSDEDLIVAYAGTLVRMGRHREALPLIENVLDESPDYVRCALWGAEACFALHRFDDAGRYVIAALKTDPTWALGHYWSARVAEVSGDAELRERGLQTALDLQPTLVEAIVSFACLKWSSGDTDEAFRLFRHAEKIAPWSGLVEATFAEFLLETERGKPDLDILIEKAERLPYTRLPYFVGLLLRRFSDRDADSLRLLKLAAATMPDDVDARIAVAQGYMLNQLWAEGAHAFQSVLEYVPTDSEAWRGLATAHQNTGATMQAMECYRKALELEPDNEEAHHGLGMVLEARSELATAIEHYRRAIALKPDVGDFRLSLASALVDIGDREESRRELARAAELLGNTTEIEAVRRRLQ
jgi:tetratricopeptide (TPR) repeat protein